MSFVDQVIDYKITSKVKYKFRQAGYIGDTVLISQEELYKLVPTSMFKFSCICDECKVEFQITGAKLRRSQGKDGKKGSLCDDLTLCSKCRSKHTLFTKYNGKYPSQTKEFIEKRKKTCLERFGAETTFQSEEVKKKIRQTNLDRYGVEYVSQLAEVQEKRKQTMDAKTEEEIQASKDKMKQTCLERYGVDCAAKADIVKEKRKQTIDAKTEEEKQAIKDKIKQTCLERYGVEYFFQADEVKEKIKQACLDKYGVSNPLKSKQILEKMKKTNLERYGVEYTLQSKEIQAKSNITYHQNGTGATSRPQQYLYDILSKVYKCELNYPLANYLLDIVLVDDKIDIEYNGGGHTRHVKQGTITQQQCDILEKRRDYYIFRHFGKLIKVISSTDQWFYKKTMTDEQIIKLIQIAREYLMTTEHHWVDINLEDRIIKTSQFVINFN